MDQTLEELYISDAQLYLEECLKNKKIKVMEEFLPIKDGVTLWDISLHKKGPLEDRIYIKNKYYLANIRRGNSLARYGGGPVFFCRRGMRKFYDLEKKYIEIMLHIKQHKLIGYHKRVMESYRETITNMRGTINLYRMFKENGEHCQISYIVQVQKWLIASKNVTILISDEKDLDWYQKERYIWACLIGKAWLETLTQVSSQDKLKLFLQTHTMIGEYCGNDAYQHIIRYDKIQIIFYAITSNNSFEPCLDVEQGLKIFQEFNLQFVRVEKSTGLKSPEEVLKQLETWLQKVGTASMISEGEGSVVYIEEEFQNKKQIISFCKLKTTEYLIYRKLREILKILAQRNLQKSETENDNLLSVSMHKFYTEYQLITEFYKPLKPLAYYLSLAQLCFQQVYQQKIEFLEIRYQFVTFLEKMQFQHQQKNLEQQFVMIQNQQLTRPTRIIIITLPFLISDDQLHMMKQDLKVPLIEGSYINPRDPSQVKKGRSISLVYLIPKLPYNLVDESSLEDPNAPNLILFFYGLDQKGQKVALQRLGDIKYQQQNPISSGFAAQFTTAKVKDRQPLLNLWERKASQYCQESSQTFPNRTHKFDLSQEDQLITKLSELFQQFEIQTERRLQQETEEYGENSDNISDQEEEQQQQTQQEQCQLIVIYPLLVPGCGKSTLIPELERICKQFTNFDYLSSDDIRSEIMEKSEIESQTQNAQRQFKRQQFVHKNLFNTQLYEKFVEIGKLKKDCVLYIDKVMVPSTLMSCMDNINAIVAELQTNANIINLGILPPLVSSDDQVIDSSCYSYNQYVTLARRLFQRDFHSILADDPVYKLKVLTKTINLFSKVKQKQTVYKKLNLHYQVHLNQFKDLVKIDKKPITKLIDQCITVSAAQRDLGEGECFSKLVELLHLEFQGMILTQQEQIITTIKKDALKISEEIKKILVK